MKMHEVEGLETRKQMRDLAFRLFIDKDILKERLIEAISDPFKDSEEALNALLQSIEWWFGLVEEKEQGVYEALLNLTNRLNFIEKQKQLAKALYTLGVISIDHVIDIHCNVEELYNLIELNHSY